jgi:RNA ligase (TIGR02306 family)
MRKLASIQRIWALDPIEGADAIEKAHVLGWQVVVKKGEFKTGDLVVYCEIDSILPDRPEFEFLKARGMRVRTIRLRGQVSQGICFPLSILPDDFEVELNKDCTEALGIIKYEPVIPACLSGIMKGRFPSFIPKTDEPRVQLLQEILNSYKGEKCYVTEKIDGSSTTYFLNNGEFGVCSRNMELVETSENSFWILARKMEIEPRLRSLNRNLALQGELIGDNIQGNRLKIRGQVVRFFNAFDIDKSDFLAFNDFIQLMKNLDLPTVPVISTDYALSDDMNEIIRMATTRSTICPDVWAEGIVIRSLGEAHPALLYDNNFINGRISFKAINPEFLLKYGE